MTLLPMSSGIDLQFDVLAQQFVNSIDRMIINHQQYVPKIGFWVNAIELHSTKQAVQIT